MPRRRNYVVLVKPPVLPPRGWSLLELLVCVAVAGLLSLLAAPSWGLYRQHAHAQQLAQRLVHAGHWARSEAMKHQAPALLAPRDGGNDWTRGWRAFVDLDLSGSYTAGDVLLHEYEATPAALQLRGNGMAAERPSYLRFDAAGYAKYRHGAFGATTMTLGYCTHSCSGTNPSWAVLRLVKIAASGRLRACNPHTDNTCTSSSLD